MNQKQLKTLLKHIILEIQKNEMIVNKDYPPDVMGAVNVEENEFYDNWTKQIRSGQQPESDFVPTGQKKRTAIWNYWEGKCKKCGNVEWVAAGPGPFKCSKCSPKKEQPGTGAVNVEENIDPRLADICTARLKEMGRFDKANLLRHSHDMKELHSYLRDRVFGKDAPTLEFVKQCVDQWKTGVGEQTATGAVAGYSTPFAFKKTKKKIKEKTLPDGRYVDDMEDPYRSNKVAGLSEMSTSSGAGGQEGGTIKVAAWGTKNKLGSPGAIAATKKMKGWKIAKSITYEGQ